MIHSRVNKLIIINRMLKTQCPDIKKYNSIHGFPWRFDKMVLPFCAFRLLALKGISTD